jgi:hypothetical protein
VAPDDRLAVPLAARAGRSPWADRALIYLLEKGEITPWTDEATAPYRQVLDRGEPFLREHPESDEWPSIAHAVGLAHETAWSLSKVPAGEEGFDSRAWASAAPAHRARALELYDHVQRHPKAFLLDPHVLRAMKRRMVRLRLDVDTGERRYYPLSDC